MTQKHLSAKDRKKRYIDIYYHFCIGYKYHQLVDLFCVSKKTVERSIKWGEENIELTPDDKLLRNEILRCEKEKTEIYELYKKAIDGEKVKALYYARHIGELSEKILKWKNLIKSTIEYEHKVNLTEDQKKKIDKLIKNTIDKTLGNK